MNTELSNSNQVQYDVEIISPMSKEEAKNCLSNIRYGLSSVRANLVALYERMGWKALGYESFRACAVAEFGTSTSHIYRQLAAAKTEKALDVEIGSQKESHLRVLSMVLPEQKDIEDAWHVAMAANENPKAYQFLMAAHTTYTKEYAHDNIWENLVNGKITPQSAYNLAKVIEGEDAEFTEIASLCTDPAMVPVLKRLCTDNTPTWEEIKATKCIPGLEEQIPLHKAVRSNLVAWLNIASAEHRAAAIANNRGYYVGVKHNVDAVIREARLVKGYPNLRMALIEYDSALERTKDANENSIP